MVTALLKPRVVARADVGQHGELLATKSRRATPIAATEADVFGPDPCASRPQALRQLIGTIHGAQRQELYVDQNGAQELGIVALAMALDRSENQPQGLEVVGWF